MLPLIPRPASLIHVPGGGGFLPSPDDLGNLSAGGQASWLRQEVREEDSEDYELVVSSEGVRIAGGESGIALGRKTLNQLLSHALGEAAAIPSIRIEDGPRFSWRGVHLDCCRHFMPVAFLKRFIDLFSAYKFNVFHWHLTEDQGWRIEIAAFPELTEKGAWRKNSDGSTHGGYYSQADVKDVVAYAADRGVSVVPEIELPGHAVAALTARPELACFPKEFVVENRWGIFEDVFCAGKESTFDFFETVLGEVADLFPSPWFHVGGDECLKARWKACPLCQKRLRADSLADEDALQSYFIRRVERMLKGMGKALIGWDEILEGGLAPEATVMSWRGMKGGIEAAQAGHRVIMSPTDHCYLDFRQTRDPSESVGRPNDFRSLEETYAFEPVPPGFTSEQAVLIIGGQANLWTEYMPTPEAVEYSAFPRLCSLAEVLWSPGEGKDFADFRERLCLHRRFLDERDVAYCPAEFC
ncbi:MAG: beta-N-acetylhexosaminidase [Verrucomicrobiota bacterium]